CLTFSVVAGCIFVVGGILEAYYATGAWANNCDEVGGDGVVHNGCRAIIEWGFASAFCFILAVLYFISAFFAHNNKYFD
uniref:MARVEL domain-containing protein n=1 Tax=Plectus sambesii TaxID=2011161 RepID=A0A914V9K7_9BILA